MSKEDKNFIHVKPKEDGVIFFEGSSARIPEEGTRVRKSIYYIRLLKEGSIVEYKPKKEKEIK